MMDQTRKQWRPTPEEVDRIVAEMRPLIVELAKRQTTDSQSPAPRRRAAAR